jgi:hypothetical protein
MKLNRLRWIIVALPLKLSVPKKIVAPEDALKRADQSPIFFSTGMHPKALQHFSRSPESDCLTFLLDCQGRQEDRNQPVLPKGHAELGMARDLKHKPAVPPLVQELILRQAPDRQAAKHKGPRAETQILRSLLAFDSDHLNAAGARQFLFGDEEVGVFELKYLGSGCHPRRTVEIGRRRKWNEAKWTPMVVVRAYKDPAVIAMECRANRGTNDSALYLEKTSIRGGQRGKR